jgi:hypothetical protein
MRPLIFAVAVAIAAATAPSANAVPGPLCPGDGFDQNVLGADGGYCDFLYLPNGTHVHCEWGGFSLGMMFPISETNNCWRVNEDGSRVPPPVAPQRDSS